MPLSDSDAFGDELRFARKLLLVAPLLNIGPEGLEYNGVQRHTCLRQRPAGGY